METPKLVPYPCQRLLGHDAHQITRHTKISTITLPVMCLMSYIFTAEPSLDKGGELCHIADSQHKTLSDVYEAESLHNAH